MAYAWQSVEEAAVTLGVSARTLHRRIAKGEVETRLDNGRREVLVCLPDEEPEETEASTDTRIEESLAASDEPLAGSELIVAHQQVALAQEKVRRTEIALVALGQTSEILQREARRTRVSARLAWAALALCSVGVYVAVGWTATKVTQAEAEKKYLNQELGNVASEVKQNRQELIKVREDLGQARQTAARLEGELSATRAALTDVKIEQAKSATQPSLLSSIAKRLAATEQ